jgi:hypothetical protein
MTTAEIKEDEDVTVDADPAAKKPSTLAVRKLLVDIAGKDAGKMEASRNQAPWIKPYWPSTTYPEGYANREPYCAAAMCKWVDDWLALPEVIKAFGKSKAELEKWRCKSARAFDWQDWAKAKKLPILGENAVLHTADVVVFDMSHIGLVYNDDEKSFYSIEANTGATGGRDGDGCFKKVRNRTLAKCFIRLLA